MINQEPEKMFDAAMESHALGLYEMHLAVNKPPPPAPVVAYTGPRAWFVVQAVSRGEDDLVKVLKARGHDFYLPKMRKEIFHGRAKKVVTRTFVLFNRYVFAHLPCSPDDWGDLLDQEPVDHVLGSLGWRDEALMEEIRKGEADMAFDETREAAIHRKQIGRTRRETTALRFKPGRRVRVAGGIDMPFGGFAGQVENVNGRGAVTVLLQIFGRVTPVELPPERLDVVDS